MKAIKFPCPKCDSSNTRTVDTENIEGAGVQRYHFCRDCLNGFVTLQSLLREYQPRNLKNNHV